MAMCLVSFAAFHHGGMWRWQSLTSWSFLLIVLYFAFANWVSFSVYLLPGEASHAGLREPWRWASWC